jgi:hypothetical protein
VLYNFQKQFVPHVLNGSKQHTIRAERKHPGKAGDICHLYTGLRQRGATLLGRAPCVRLEEIRLWRACLWINGEELSASERDSLAWRDGFREKVPGLTYFDVMLRFWAKAHGDVDFHGHIIHWDWDRRVNA